MPSYEAEHADFERYDAEVFGISVDSVPSHVAFAKSLGGINSYPLLADFHPKGHVAKLFGVWMDDKGINERAIFIIDKQGRLVMRILGEPDFAKLHALLEEKLQES